MKLQFCKLYTVIEKSSQEKKDVEISRRDAFGLSSTSVHSHLSCLIIDEVVEVKIATCISIRIHAPFAMMENFMLHRREFRGVRIPVREVNTRE